MSAPLRHDRRRLLQAFGAAALVSAAPPRAQAQTPDHTLNVLTAYPDEVVTRFVAAFGAAYPQYRLNMVWRMPHEALPYLQAPDQNGIDVYWSASPRTFAQIKAAQGWQVLPETLRSLPPRIGGCQLSDPQGYFVATEMAAYGFALNRARLRQRQLQAPSDWPELCDARYAGLIAMPDPARVGFAPVMLDIVLQAYGWQRGWALWQEIAGNAQLIGRGGSFVSDSVGAQGEAAVGLSIDFFVASAMANSADLDFIYPRHSGVNPGQVAVTASTAHREAALAFVGFLLSETGQALLLHPDLRKLPVRPSVYRQAPRGSFNPYLAAQAGGLDYDSLRTQARLGLLAALFEQCLSQPRAQLQALWRRIHAGEAHGLKLAAARRELCRMPIDEAQAAELAPREYARRLEAQSESAPRAIEAQWSAFAAAQREQVARLLAAAGA